MHRSVLLLATVALVSQQSYCASLNRDLRLLSVDLNIDKDLHNDLSTKKHTLQKFVILIQKPPKVIQRKSGSVVELTCEAMGSPAPSIQWFRNNQPIIEFDQDSNEVIDTNQSSLARMISTLIISRPSNNLEDEYMCLVISGHNSAVASSIVQNVESNSLFSERLKLQPLRPKIVTMYKIFMDTIGHNIVLPCRVKGHPRPNIEWYDNNNVKIENGPRSKILKSGELVLFNLQWSDMGEFTCRTSNSFGTVSAATFVYPVKAG